MMPDQMTTTRRFAWPTSIKCPNCGIANEPRVKVDGLLFCSEECAQEFYDEVTYD